MLTPHNLEQQVRTFVIENFLFGRAEELRDDTSFLETGLVDSTGILELVAFLENTYGIKINDEELIPENLDSIRSIVDFLARKTASLAVEVQATGREREGK